MKKEFSIFSYCEDHNIHANLSHKIALTGATLIRVKPTHLKEAGPQDGIQILTKIDKSGSK